MFRYINMPMAMNIAVFIFNTRPVGITGIPHRAGYVERLNYVVPW